ncbi:BTAD domain-containing putative transcriptional regulator [uncultured Hydrogenophaga sp.]|uniref:BTAD domain-containing putative transcriptional regulator n=1 Tax=uncultured Hydrogenophaga sp. TaxID=199683 RepID=UPI00265F28FB|nr:BTAD domain-containing putative transcriptional regulator [uncultured Hydrogenophaga sp.]
MTETTALQHAIDEWAEQGDWVRVLPLVTQLVRIAPEDPASHWQLANCLHRLGRPTHALGVYACCVAMAGRSPAPLLRMGECLRDIGQTREALQCLDACVEIARTDPDHRALQLLAEQLAHALRR